MIFLEDLEKLISDVQAKNQMLQNIMMQKQTMMMQSKELEQALDAIEKNDDEIYKAVGPILIKSTKEDVKNELSEKKEDIDIKVKSIERQEKKMTEHIKESQKTLQSMLNERKSAN